MNFKELNLIILYKNYIHTRGRHVRNPGTQYYPKILYSDYLKNETIGLYITISAFLFYFYGRYANAIRNGDSIRF